MNVQNRKLFRTTDARQKLAAMGGIMASSPELMGEAQRFQDGGQAVSEEQYVVFIPGITGPRTPLRLSLDTMIRLQDSVPELMGSATVLDTETAEDRGIDVRAVRPGDAFVERRVMELLSEPVEEMGVEQGFVPPEMGATELNLPSIMAALDDASRSQAEPPVEFTPEEVSEPQANTFAGIEDSGLDAREAALQNAGRMSAQEMMDIELSDVDAGMPVELMPAVNEVRIQPELPPKGILATIAALATSDDNRRNEILSPSYDPNNRGGPEEFQPEISPEMAEQLRVLEQRRTSRAVAEGAGDLAKGAGQGAVTGARTLNDALNVTGGYLADTGLTGLSLGADALGYLTGGGDVSAALFNAGNSLSDAADTFTPEGNLLPRLFNGAEPEPEPDLEAERLAQIEAESLRNITDAIVAGDEGLFAEGSVSEPLLGGVSQSILDVSRGSMPSPETPRFSSAGDGPQLLSSPEMTDELNRPVEEMAVESARRAPSLPGYDTSTGVPLTMAEVAESVLVEREQEAEAGRTNTQEEEDRFPQEDARIAAQEAALSEIRTRRLSDQEREQMAMGTNTGVGLTVEDAAAAVPEAVINEDALKSSLRPQSRPDPESAAAAAEAAAAALAAAEAADGDGNVAGTITANLPGGKQTSSIEEATKQQYKFLKDFMGITDKDKQKEFQLLSMQFFSALASGQSPDALSNLAGAASTAVNNLSASAKEKAKLDQDLKLASYERAGSLQAAAQSRQDAMTRAFIGAGLMPIVDKATGQITGYKPLPGKNNSTYTPERLRQAIVTELTKDKDFLSDQGILTKDGVVDKTKLDALVKSFMEGGLGSKTEKSPEQLAAETKLALIENPAVRAKAIAQMEAEGFSTEGLS